MSDKGVPVIFCIFAALMAITIFIVNMVTYSNKKILLEKISEEIIVVDSPKKLSKLRDGDLIYLSDNILVKNSIIDKDLNIFFDKKPIIKRIVKMYQKEIRVKYKNVNQDEPQTNYKSNSRSGFSDSHRLEKHDNHINKNRDRFNQPSSRFSEYKREESVDQKANYNYDSEHNNESNNKLKNNEPDKQPVSASSSSSSKGSSFGKSSPNKPETVINPYDKASSASSSKGSSFNLPNKAVTYGGSNSSSSGSSFSKSNKNVGANSDPTSIASSVTSNDNNFNHNYNNGNKGASELNNGNQNAYSSNSNNINTNSGSSGQDNYHQQEKDFNSNTQVKSVPVYEEYYSWSERPEDAKLNPDFAFQSENFTPDYIEIGAFKLDKQNIIGYMQPTKKIYLSENNIEKVRNYFNEKHKNDDSLWNYLFQSKEFKYKTIRDGELYLTKDKNLFYPSIGDYKIAYYELPNDDQISIIGEKRADRIVPKYQIDGSSEKNVMFIKNKIMDLESFMTELKEEMQNAYFWTNIIAFIILVIGGFVFICSK